MILISSSGFEMSTRSCFISAVSIGFVQDFLVDDSSWSKDGDSDADGEQE